MKTEQDMLPLAAMDGTAHGRRVPGTDFRVPLEGPTRYTLMDSPIGELTLTGDGEALTGIHTRGTDDRNRTVQEGWVRDDTPFAEAVRQLRAYFDGRLRDFDLPLAPSGTEWQRTVWRALTTVPYGRTASYGELARDLDRPGSSRAVGSANGRNPISIVVPCHRIIGADGTLTGYSGGVWRKELLLGLETRTLHD
ncbi:methylated-DNA--[protein]-cysteine S-methyltransferase [Nocardiopsis kunsanensis]|uniref:Methylated-DNA--protein-cysteine methyltransferase n=1 Tax=Nocardiopsis kunsanensis TaxID=141693 RepID=A0A918XFU5_9ACTN|nr:methylated-DNA--[protein]-cysteine S-methyltransferase [Nocardiopsis kunsanensis]GHD30180.1 methylated-DNA--protein-cysteine methyltransferase [Nocardiopsis kunsanensis]